MSDYQNLPLFILDQIVNYMVDKACVLQSSLDKGYISPGARYKAVMHTCRNWRKAALCSIYANMSINLQTTNKDEVIDFNVYTSLFKTIPIHISNRYVKSVDIYVDSSDILDGSAYHAMRELLADDLQLPNAWSLKVEISYDNDNSRKGNMQRLDTKNVDMFADYIKLFIPRLASVQIEFNMVQLLNNPNQHCLFNKTIVPFYRNIPRRSLVLHTANSINTKELEFINGLSKLALFWDGNYKANIQLIHANSPTLTYLELIYTSRAQNIHELFYRGNMMPITYPNLMDLRLKYGYSLNDAKRPTVGSSIVPFPKLRRLVIDVMYPFGDDVLFRGNSQTLEHLEFVLDRPTVSTLLKCKVFDSGRYSKLRSIYAKSIVYNNTDVAMSDQDFSAFVFATSCSAQRIKLMMLNDVGPICSIVSKSQNLQHLSTLMLSSAKVNLDSTLVLLKYLPNLTILHCKSVSIDSGRVDMDVANLIAFSTREETNSLGKQLKEWHIWHSGDQPMMATAKFAIVLAALCPRFSRFVTTIDMLNEYKHAVTECLECLDSHNALHSRIKSCLLRPVL